MPKTNDIINTLRSSGLRPTKQRIKIAEYLFDRESTFHFNVETIDKEINSKSGEENISLATIYNTVNAFKDHGHLKEVKLNNDKTFYDTNTNLHHHFYDKDENILTDVAATDVHVSKIPSAPIGKKVDDIEVTINVSRKK